MKIHVKLREELIIDSGIDADDPEIKISSEDVKGNDLYLDSDQYYITLSVGAGTKEIRDKFAEFCDNVYFFTRRYESTKGQIPTKVLFSREGDDIGVFLILKPEFFKVEVF